MRASALVALLAILWGIPCPGSASPQDYPKLSPFSGLRWNGSVPEVEIEKTWYELLAIQDVSTSDVVEFCKRRDGELWKKRFGEDLVEVLSRMGHEPASTVALKVRDLETGVTSTLQDVEMTEEKLEAIRRARGRLALLPRKDVEEDIARLDRYLEGSYAYLRWKGVDHGAALKEVRSALGDGIPRGTLAVKIQKVLSLFGDGHTRVDPSTMARALTPGFTPFLIGDAGQRLFIFQEDRSDFVDPDTPFLKSIDGLEMDVWLRAAAEIVPRGSPQMVRHDSIRNLRYIQHLREELGLERSGTMRIVLESSDGERARRKEVPVASRKPIYGEWPRTGSQILPGEIGYLRLPRMRGGGDHLDGLRRAMDRFRETRGLIIDVRGNGGGSRAALRVLLPYFMREGEPPQVVNLAVCRLPEPAESEEEEGYLQDRFLHPITSSVWSEEEREAIRVAAGPFVPEWSPPRTEFSAWHYFLLKPTEEKEAYRYDRPVVILMDAGCFSATDIFLGAFQGRKGITLLGTPSAGGSGRAKEYELPRSGIRFKLSSMASFRPDGRMYDGSGIEPDIPVSPIPTDWLGRTDSVLDAALKLLKPE